LNCNSLTDQREQSQIKLAMLDALPENVSYANIVFALLELAKKFTADMVYGKD